MEQYSIPVTLPPQQRRIPVSYTHLDVYKRQPLSEDLQAQIYKIPGVEKIVLDGCVVGRLVESKVVYDSPEAVSYTHLISHQVKTPVSNLKMATDTLLEKPMTEAERTDFIRGIRTQTDKLDFLFQALVKTSRLETGVIQLNKKPVCLFDTVAQAMSGIVYAAEKKKIAVSVDCPENLTFSHDSKWTSEALFNLLDNAVKYTPAGGKITVSVIPWEMYVEIKVADTGKGISESNQAAIFRRFYREEEVHEQQGVGIGLYLSLIHISKISRSCWYMMCGRGCGTGRTTCGRWVSPSAAACCTP